VHLVDTDGAFVNETYIKQGDVEKWHYSPDAITGSSIDQILRRNSQKSQILNRLSSKPAIAGIQYSLYYFSCNLDHILHDEPNLDDNMKTRLAEEFSDRYYDSLEGFIVFFNSEIFAVRGDRRESWDFYQDCQ
jgi:hypothetical protein